ncbi:hypothetical protein AMK17_38440 [Streptomyces sp. CB00072]|nr:hypothetical protein AMK17_38440 [Streptomyces sp. CB00072]
MITGRAAACSSRSSKASSRRYGRADRDIPSACGQPGRMVSGVMLRARRAETSAAFVVGRSTAAVIDLEAMSTSAVRPCLRSVVSRCGRGR